MATCPSKLKRYNLCSLYRASQQTNQHNAFKNQTDPLWMLTQYKPQIWRLNGHLCRHGMIK